MLCRIVNCHPLFSGYNILLASPLLLKRDEPFSFCDGNHCKDSGITDNNIFHPFGQDSPYRSCELLGVYANQIKKCFVRVNTKVYSNSEEISNLFGEKVSSSKSLDQVTSTYHLF